jgi:hypothetical protein
MCRKRGNARDRVVGEMGLLTALPLSYDIDAGLPHLTQHYSSDSLS